MKKIIFGLLSSIAVLTLNGQNLISNGGFESWTNNIPDGWMGNKTTIDTTYVLKSDSTPFEGNSSLQLIHTGSRDKLFTTKPLKVEEGASYIISYAIKGTGVIRVGIYDSVYIKGTDYDTATANWQTYSEIVTTKNSSENAQFLIYVNSTTQSGIFIDNVIVTSYFGADILNFELIEEIRPAIINSKTAQISSTVHWTADMLKLDPIITLYEGAQVTATILPIVFDGINPVEYKVTGPQGSIKFWKVLVKLAEAPAEVSINTIQFTEDESGNSPLMGKLITTSGIVTAKGINGYYIQDGQGAWNGIWVNNLQDTTEVKTGDKLSITGIIRENNKQTEITEIVSITIVDSENALPLASFIKIPDLTEAYEGVLSGIERVTCITESAGSSEWIVADDSLASIPVSTTLFIYDAKINEEFASITGILSQTSDTFILVPRNREDVVIAIGVKQTSMNQILIYPNPTPYQFTIDNMININKLVISNVLGQVVMVQHISEEKLIINSSDFKSGIYIVTFYSDKNINYSKKLIKE